jgi:hypothetical protein
MTPGPSSIDDYLSRLGQAEGPSSEFSLNALGALKKMGRFQLPHAGYWAVKMVQGAVAAGCFGVEFRMTARHLICRVLGAPVPSAHGLLKQMLSGQAPRERSQRHWIVALRSLYGEEPQTWSWVSEIDGIREEVLFVDGNQPLRRAQPTTPPWIP